MPLDEAAKKAALRMVPYALYLVGVRNPRVTSPAADLNAFVGSWVTQTSFKPPLVVLGLKRDTRGNAMVREAGVFTLNLLGDDQKDLAQRFFKDLPVDEATFGGVPYRRGETGAPVFPDCPAYVECRVVAVHEDGGDHDVVVGEVVAAGVHREGARPLTHAETGWHYGG